MLINIFKKYILFISAFCFSKNIFSQELSVKKISQKERNRGIIYKYVYEASNSYNVINLILNKDKTYEYENLSNVYISYSKGVWDIKKDVLVLNSFVKNKEIPVKILYIDTVDIAQKQKIHVVKNNKNEPLTDIYVYINNDSTKCLPLVGSCSKEFDQIDSVKIQYENGLTSSWIKVQNRSYEALSVVIDTDLNLSNYQVFNNKKYKMTNKGIIQLDCDK